MKLRINYRDSEGQVTERVISDVVLEPPKMLNAFCHLRGENRSFVLSRIEHAVDLDTGETIPDLWDFFGLPSQKPAPPEMPVFFEQPQSLSLDEARNLRKADKYALLSRFKIDSIKELYWAKLWALFEDRCFRCGSTNMLELDHHIPQFLGGRLVPGNLVLLCSQCNLDKKDKHPEEFYTPRQISRLAAIFQAQLNLFDFHFDWSRWNHDPKEYLLSLGIPETDIERALNSEDRYNDNYWINVENKRRKVCAHIHLKYRKSNDQITERRFDVESFSRGQEGYHIHGFCHNKKKHMTLSSLGFIDPTDIETGEAISDIKSYLEVKYATTTNHKEDLLFDKYGWAIYSLVYLSSTAGSIQKNERDIIITFIKSLDGFSELKDDRIDSTIKNIYRPGKMEIRRWTKTAFLNGENVQLIIPVIEKLALLHKNENPEFKSFVKYLSTLPKARTAAATDQTDAQCPRADIEGAMTGLIGLINIDEERARFDAVRNESYKADALIILSQKPPACVKPILS